MVYGTCVGLHSASVPQ